MITFSNSDWLQLFDINFFKQCWLHSIVAACNTHSVFRNRFQRLGIVDFFLVFFLVFLVASPLFLVACHSPTLIFLYIFPFLPSVDSFATLSLLFPLLFHNTFNFLMHVPSRHF